MLTRLEQTALLAKLRTLILYSASDDDLRLAHDLEHIESIKKTGLSTSEGQCARDVINSQSDLFATQETIQAARDAAGATIAVTEMVLRGDNGINRGIAIVRPPGHHAETDCHSGFCFFNNIAVAAKVAIERFDSLNINITSIYNKISFVIRYSVERILVVDIDIHHGNGCQQIFYDDPRVLHISIHRQSFAINGDIVQYSDEGTLSRIGSGAGLGYNVNIAVGQIDQDEPPRDVGTVEGAVLGDADYMYIFYEIVLPLAREFRPELVLVPAGT